MFTTVLFMLLAFLGGALGQSNSGLNTLQQLDRVNADLAKNYKLDSSNLPFIKTNIQDGGICTSARRLHRRLGVAPLYADVEFFDWNTLYKIDNVTVSNQNHTDAELINNTKSPSTLSVATSTAVADATTSGWTITTKGSFSGIDITGQYQSSATHTVTQTKTVTESITCNVGEICKIQTFTFTANIYGTCWNQTWIDTNVHSPQRALCKDGSTSECGHIIDKYEQICTAGTSTSQPDVPCVVSVPIFDGSDNGNLLTLMVASSERA
ncbi:hypothetical protein DV735_g5142, partial [Chaetothyriales sp. CBS 134920]